MSENNRDKLPDNRFDPELASLCVVQRFGNHVLDQLSQLACGIHRSPVIFPLGNGPTTCGLWGKLEADLDRSGILCDTFKCLGMRPNVNNSKDFAQVSAFRHNVSRSFLVRLGIVASVIHQIPLIAATAASIESKAWSATKAPQKSIEPPLVQTTEPSIRTEALGRLSFGSPGR